MSKKTKRFLSILMTFIMIMVSVPIPELKVHAGSGVWIGDQEMVEGTPVAGTSKGSVTLTVISGTNVLTFDDFEGVDGSHKEGADYFQVYSDKSLTIHGKAAFDGEIGAIGCNGKLIISEDADLSMDLKGRSINNVSGDTDIYGKIEVSDKSWSTGIRTDGTITFYDGCDVKVGVGANFASAVEANGDVVVNGGNIDLTVHTPLPIDIMLMRGHSAAMSGKNVTINRGTVKIDMSDEKSVGIGSRDGVPSDGKITINGGTVIVTASGEGSVAIGSATNYFGYVELNGGDITLSGTAAAIQKVKNSITVGTQMLWKDPETAPDYSDGMKGLVDSDGNPVTSVHLTKPEDYGIWVGNNKVTSENKDNIEGILGGGKASFDPESRTLTFTGNVTGVENLCTYYGKKTYIYAEEDLTIEGDATFDSDEAECGIDAGGTAASLTINGNISVKAKEYAIYSMMDLNIGGKAKAESTSSTAGVAVNAQNITVEEGELEATGNMETGSVVNASLSIKVFNGSLSVNALSEESAATVRGIYCFGDMNLYGGKLWAESKRNNAIIVDGSFKAEGAQIEINGSAPSEASLLVDDDVILNGGKININSENNDAVTCKNMSIYGAIMSVNAKDTGIHCGNKFYMESGILEAEVTSDTGKAIEAGDGVTLEPDVTIAYPVNGKTKGDTIVDENETAPAKKVKLESEVTYPVWIGETQVTEENKNSIPVEGGTASYNEVTRTLTFNGDVTGISTSYENAGIKYKIYSMDVLGLTIKGKASIKDTNAHTGIYVYGSRLTIDGDIDVYGKDEAVLAVNGEICVNGKLTAESNGSDSTVKCPGNITLDGEGLFAENGSTNHAVSTSKKLILKSGVLEAESASQAVWASEGIVKAAGYEITIPEDGEFPADNTTVVEKGTTDPAKKVRIEKLEKYNLWVGDKQVTSLNKDNIPGILGGGSASYNEVTKTLTFSGNVTGVNGLDAATKNAIIYSKDELIIEGDITSDISALPADTFGIYSEDKLTINGNLNFVVKECGIFAEEDLVVNGDVVIGSQNTGVTVGKDLIVDEGSLSANCAGSSLSAIVVKHDADVRPQGSLTAINDADAFSKAVEVGGELYITGTVLVKKSKKDGFALRAGHGICVGGGSLDIINDEGNGIEETDLNVKGGIVNITIKGSEYSAPIHNSTGYGVKIEGGILNVVTEKNKGIYCPAGKFEISGGQVNVEAGSTAIEADEFKMTGGRLTAWNKAKTADSAIKSSKDIDLSDDVDIVDPVGGKISDDKKTIVNNDDTVANKVVLSAPTKYNVWVGSTQVTDENQEKIPGIVGGGKASYDPVSKTLIFTGDVTGVTGLSTDGSQIYATENITITGKASLENEEADYGIHVLGYGVNVKGDLNVSAKTSAIRTEGDISISGSVVAKSGVSSEATVQTALDSKIILEAGSVNVEKTGTAGYGAISAKDLVINGGVLKARSATGKAIEVAGSITIPADFEVSEPEGGKISADGKSIVDETDAPAQSVTIEQKGVKYTVSFNMCDHGTAVLTQIIVSGNTAVKPADPTETGFTFRGWFTEKEYINEYDFSTPVTENITLYAKWTDNAPSELVSISINKAPDKTVYLVGESFDPAGMVVSANYADSKDNRIVEDYTYTPTGALVSGNTVIIVSYTEGGITKTASQNIVVKDSIIPGPDEDADVWNLFEETDRTFDIYAISAGAEIPNTNVKSAKFYNATLNGNTIDVELKAGVNRKTAAKPANTVLEFRLASGETVEYVMPVQYVKPAFKLSSTSATIKNGAATVIKTQLLYKTKGGNFEPYDLSAAEVKYGSMDVSGDMDGNISFVASAAMSGIKLSVKEEEWESAVELKFKVKAVSNDVLSVDMGSLKTVVLNTNSADQKYTFDLMLNGKDVTPADNIEISCKAPGIASVNAAGKLEISLPATAPKAGNYTVTLAKGKAKAKVKVKISAKTLSDAITMKIQSKYDVVTGQKMVVVPVFKDAGMEILDVSSTTADITAELNDGGNIEIEYTGSALNAKNLKMGDIALKLELDGVADPVSVTLKNVKAKKSTPKVKASVVNISAAAAGEVKGSVNIISTYKDGSGKYHLIAPVSVEIVSQKKAIAEKNAADMTEINIKSMDAKSGSVKVKLTYPGGVTKNVTIKVKKK